MYLRLASEDLLARAILAAEIDCARSSLSDSLEVILNSFACDDNGDRIFVPLTGRQLSEYGPLKNQYALVNTSGQVLLSERDAANYESSPDLTTFLSKYGITLEPTGETQMVENPAYTEALEQWQQDYNDWLASEPNISAYTITTTTSSTDNVLYDIFNRATADCFNSATHEYHYIDSNTGNPVDHYPDPHCYLHVLAHMIELQIIQPGLTAAEEPYHTYNSTSQADPNAYPKTISTPTSLGDYITIDADLINISYINWKPIQGEDQNHANGTELMLLR